MLAENTLKNLWLIKKHDIPVNKGDFEIIPSYVVDISSLVRGSMSLVYFGHNIETGERIAARIMNPDLKAVDSGNSWINYGLDLSLEKEAEALMSINHPGIPKVHELTFATPPGGDIPVPVMIMEHIEGENLSERLGRQVLPARELSDIINQTAGTIDYLAKEFTLFHGDLHPGQIILERPHIKLMDYGMSNKVSKTGEAFAPEFSAPERQMKGVRNLATEEFSLAAIAYHAVTGRFIDLDINAESEPVLTWRKISEKNSKYSFNNEDYDRLNQIFEKAMALDPEKRYESASRFAHDFEEVMSRVQAKS